MVQSERKRWYHHCTPLYRPLTRPPKLCDTFCLRCHAAPPTMHTGAPPMQRFNIRAHTIQHGFDDLSCSSLLFSSANDTPNESSSRRQETPCQYLSLSQHFPCTARQSKRCVLELSADNQTRRIEGPVFVLCASLPLFVAGLLVARIAFSS